MTKEQFRKKVEDLVKSLCLKNKIEYRGSIRILDLSFSIAIELKANASELLAEELSRHDIKFGTVHSLTGGDFVQTWITYADNAIYD